MGTRSSDAKTETWNRVAGAIATALGATPEEA
jgi:hypothetical protein